MTEAAVHEHHLEISGNTEEEILSSMADNIVKLIIHFSETTGIGPCAICGIVAGTLLTDMAENDHAGCAANVCRVALAEIWKRNPELAEADRAMVLKVLMKAKEH